MHGRPIIQNTVSGESTMIPNTRSQSSTIPLSSSLGGSILQYEQPIDGSTVTGATAIETSFPSLHQHQQQPWETTISTTAVAPSITRSSPIAIVRSQVRRGTLQGDDVDDGNGHNDDDDDDDDDDNNNDIGAIDVEGDAEKLRRKYGEQNIVRTYHQGGYIIPPTGSRGTTTYSSSIPNAPYLGSLSRSANQVLSMPPMSLASGQDAAYYHSSDPPESISNYGSLRDSHERGRFLDGPSSYREPASGRIRQLDHRLRYHGRRQPAELSIGERMQRSLQQKGQASKKPAGSDTASGGGEDMVGKQPPTTSSLSAIMDKISKVSSDTTSVSGTFLGKDIPTYQLGGEAWNSVASSTTLGRNTSFQEQHFDDDRIMVSNEPSSMMLSTSLTAFEVLKTSNINRNLHHRMSSSYSMNQSPSSMFALVNPSNGAAAATATTTTTANTTTALSQGYQPLARSMSDPTPRFSLLSLRDNTTRPSNPAVPTSTSTAASSSTFMVPPVIQPPPLEGHDEQRIIQQQSPLTLPIPTAEQQVPVFSAGGLVLAPTLPTGGQRPIGIIPSTYGYSNNNNESSSSSLLQLQHGRVVHLQTPEPDLDTEGAFGDMDME
jgi:hypothetical protein